MKGVKFVVTGWVNKPSDYKSMLIVNNNNKFSHIVSVSLLYNKLYFLKVIIRAKDMLSCGP